MATRTQTIEIRVFQAVLSWARSHREALIVLFAAAFWGLLFTLGLPLGSEDYSVWLKRASANIYVIALEMLVPISMAPADWGYYDRPALVLFYKILWALFEDGAWGYMLARCIAFGACIALLNKWLKRDGVSVSIRAGVLSVAATSQVTLATLAWSADPGPYIGLATIWFFAYALKGIENGPRDMSVYKGGITRINHSFAWFLVVVFFAVFLGNKIRGDFKVAVPALATYLWFFERKRFPVYGFWLLAAWILCLPWSAELFKNLPPFFPIGGTYAAGTFTPFRISGAIVAGWDTVSMGLGMAALPLAYFTARGLFFNYKPAWRKNVAFAFIWFLGFALAAGMLDRKGPGFRLERTLFPMLAPAILLSGLAFAEIGRLIPKQWKSWAWVLPALLAVQTTLNLSRAPRVLEDTGLKLRAVDMAYRMIESKYPEAKLALLPGFDNYDFRMSAVSSLRDRVALKEFDEISSMPAGQTFALSWNATLDQRFRLKEVINPCTGWLWGALLHCGAESRNSALILQFAGEAPEFGQAQTLASSGDFTGALDVLDASFTRDPGNHGLMFLAGSYAYQKGDYPRMQRYYNEFGSYFIDTVNVQYNWGLSYLFDGQPLEAIPLLARAYSLTPKDYGVGFNYADALHKAKNQKMALFILGEMLKIFPDDGAMKQAYNTWSLEKDG